jgi:hypothetical protein
MVRLWFGQDMAKTYHPLLADAETGSGTRAIYVVVEPSILNDARIREYAARQALLF